MAIMWNLWHGCKKVSEGCKFCYVYRQDAMFEKSGAMFYVTNNFDLPVKKDRKGEYKVKSGEVVFACLTSDFFLDLADDYRAKAWDYIRVRKDLFFVIITKRIERFMECVPNDWGNGWEHVYIGCTVENQRRAEQRLPIFLDLQIKHKFIICEPLLEKLDLRPFLCDQIEEVIAGGESGVDVRVCDYDWIVDLREQCKEKNISFTFKQTGAYFKKDGRVFNIKRQFQASQAQKANLNFNGKTPRIRDTGLKKDK